MTDQQCKGFHCPVPGGWIKRLKTAKGFWLNKNWYCSADCFEDGVLAALAGAKLKAATSCQRHRLPIGLMLLSKGLITKQNLQDALAAQRECASFRIGEWLCRQGLITEGQLTTALGVQWGLPLFQPSANPDYSECAGMVPISVMEAAHLAPVHYKPAGKTLYLAFSDGLDYGSLRAIEQILECTTQPCVISESQMAAVFEVIRRTQRPSETVLDCPRTPKAVARLMHDWVESNASEDVRVALASKFVWARMESRVNTGHLLFRLPEIQPDVIP